MTDADINQLRDLLRAATPGPWKNHTHEEDEGSDWATISATPVVARSGYKWTPTVGVCDGGDSVENAKNATLIVAAVNALPGLLDEIERLKRACSMLNDEVSQTLGRALGYPKFCDDQKNFPGATDADGVCVGDHVAESLAAEASKEIERLRADAARLDHIEKHARYDPKIDGNHAWWPTTFENVLRGPTLRAAIDAAMKEDGK